RYPNEPHLEYSQFIPGRDGSKGRPEGLIDSYSFVAMLSSVQLLKGSSSFPASDCQALQQWFADFAVWLQVSEQGQLLNPLNNFVPVLIPPFFHSGQDFA